MILYCNPEKERTLCDYIPLPALKAASIDSLEELQQNLYDVLETAYIYHSDFLETAIYQDIRKVELYIKLARAKQRKIKNSAEG